MKPFFSHTLSCHRQTSLGHVILLHGWGQTEKHMRPLAELLCPFFHVHLIDLPGFGQSPPPKQTWSTFDYARCIQSWLKKKEISSVHCIGHSFGGKVGICLAAQHPKAVQSLTLIGASGIRAKRFLTQRIRLAMIGWGAKAIRYTDKVCHTRFFQDFWVPKVASQDYQKAGPMRKILVKSIHDDLRSSLQQIHCQTLLLWGEKDTASPITTANTMHSCIPSSQLVIFPEKGHFLLQDVSTHLVCRYVLPFLLQPA